MLDPVSNQTYITAAAGGQADIDLAVAAASRAFAEGPWPRLAARERANILNRIADAVDAQDAALRKSRRSTPACPSPRRSGRQRAAENFRFFADLIVAQADDIYQVPGGR